MRMENRRGGRLVVLLAEAGATGEVVAGDTRPRRDTGSAAAAARRRRSGAQTPAAAGPGEDNGPRAKTGPNELGKLLVLEYHRIGNNEGEWIRSEAHFRNDLRMLWDRGYRPVTMRDVANGNINIPEGTSPVVFVFDE